MSIADEKVALLEQSPVESATGHDARSLVVAILLCVVCWAALGYYLLT